MLVLREKYNDLEFMFRFKVLVSDSCSCTSCSKLSEYTCLVQKWTNFEQWIYVLETKNGEEGVGDQNLPA